MINLNMNDAKLLNTTMREKAQEIALKAEAERHQKALQHIDTAPLEVLEAEDRERKAREAFEKWWQEI